MNDVFDVCIVGAGVAGASAAYHLQQQAGVRSVLVLEAGSPGVGRLRGCELGCESLPHANRSGSAVMDNGGEWSVCAMRACACFRVFVRARAPNERRSRRLMWRAFWNFSAAATRIKMVVNLYPATSLDFIKHHGRDGARRYLRAARRGIDLQKRLARQVGADLLSLGSLYVAEAADVAALESEFRLLQSLGCECELWDQERTERAAGGKQVAQRATSGGDRRRPTD